MCGALAFAACFHDGWGRGLDHNNHKKNKGKQTNQIGSNKTQDNLIKYFLCD